MAADPQVERLRAELARLVAPPNTEGAGAEHFAEILGLFLANIPDFILLLATDGTILFLNRARPGKTIAEVVGRNVYEYSTDHEGRMRATIGRVVATGETVSLESSARFSDGSMHDFLTRFAPVFSGDSVVAVASIATEVTAQKRAEAALRDSEQMLRVAVAATGMGLWSWDTKQDVVNWDDEMCRIYGVTRDTVPRTLESYLSMLHPEDRDRQREGIAHVVHTGEYPDVEQRIVRPDGTIRKILCMARAIRASDGTVEKFIGGSLDVTERRALEERARQTQKLEAVGQLSAGVAHNFNNMLTAILPNIELAMVDASPRSAASLRAASEAGRRAADLVRQLMTFAGRARPREKRARDVRVLVERTVIMCRRAFDPRIELSVQCSALPQPVVSDETQLEQALFNLLINARDAVLEADVEPKLVSVHVERIQSSSVDGALGLEAGREYACIRVVDNGVGMDAATSSRIYEPFFTTKEVGKGTGLGLSTARTTVREHDGVLDCCTTKDKGTTFSMFLPLAGAVNQSGEFAISVEGAAPSPRTILVVDDEAPVREVTRRMLERAGYLVHVAAGGPEALDLLSNDALRRKIDLVLLDLSMPGMSGEAVRAELRARAPSLKVAYFSGHAVDASLDVVGVVEKPTTYAALVRRIREFLERTEG